MDKLITKSFFEHILISYLLFVPFIPIFKVIDRIGPQFSYLSIMHIVIYAYLFFFRRADIKIAYLKSNSIVIAYFSFIIISLLSFIFSININESLVEWNQYLTFFNSLLTITFLLYINKKLGPFILKMIIVLLGLEVIKTISVFLEFYDSGLSFTRIREYQGFSSNQNIGAFSILIKIPLLIYFIFKTKQKFYISLLYFLLITSFFSIFIIGSRGAILGIIICLSSIIIWSMINYQKLKVQDRTKMFLIISSFFLVGIFQKIIYKDSDISIINRAVSLVDESTNYRLERYKDAIYHIYHNPFIGTGIGTWKIKASYYGKDDMKGYQVAYHAHNDFLQIAAETGVFGLLGYSSIFLSLIYLLCNKYIFHTSIEDKFFYFSLILMAIVFLIDSSLNFPRIRPYSQIVILYLLGFMSVNRKSVKL